MIEGADDEDPYLGVGGTIVPLSNPSKTARAIYRLLSDQAYYNRASSSMRMRVEKLYHKQRQFTAYQNLYNSLNAG